MTGNDIIKAASKNEKKMDEKTNSQSFHHGMHGGNPKFRNERNQQNQGSAGRGRRGRGPSGHPASMGGHHAPAQNAEETLIKVKKEDGEKPDEETEAAEKKFTGRCRLFVGNLPNDTKEDAFKKLFEPFGEFTEVYVNTLRGFGFIRMDTRQNAENAKNSLDGMMKKGRMLRVRFATHGAALRLKCLPSCVTNELLESAFEQFGEVERAIVSVDDRGKPTGEGIIEFARKPGAQAAIKRIREGVFLMSTTPRPIQVEILEQIDECDGYPEKFAQKNQEFLKEREQPPRFARMGSFEFEYGRKWQQMYLHHQSEEENLKRQFEENVSKLELDMANGYMEHQTQMLREDLMKRQEELRRLEEAHQMEIARRLEMRKQEEERRRGEDERRHMDIHIRQDEQRRQQELFMQQERAMREMSRERGRGAAAPPMPPPPAPPVSMGLERGSRQSQGIGNGQDVNKESGSGSSAIKMLLTGSSSMESQSQSQSSQNMRQSRFDQPPGFQNQLGNIGGNGHAGPMGRSHMSSDHRMEQRLEEIESRGMESRSMESRSMESRSMEQHIMDPIEQRNLEQRAMEQRARAERPVRGGGDEFYENKRARRY